MKKLFTSALVLLVLFTSLPFPSDAAVRVRGYFRKDGTYVQPHYRSNPDGNPYNNWSYPGNVNPYTGKVAPGNPSTYLENYYNKNSGSSSGNSYSIPSNSAAVPETGVVHISPSLESHRIFQIPGTQDVWELSDWQAAGYGTRAGFDSAYAFEKRYGHNAWTQIKPISQTELDKYAYVGHYNSVSTSGAQVNSQSQADTSKPYLPANAYWSTQTQWRCYDGFRETATGCEKLTLPANAYWTTQTQWRCYDGYRETVAGCEKLYLPLHAYWTTQTQWRCYDGYTETTTGCLPVQ